MASLKYFHFLPGYLSNMNIFSNREACMVSCEIVILRFAFIIIIIIIIVVVVVVVTIVTTLFTPIVRSTAPTWSDTLSFKGCQ